MTNQATTTEKSKPVHKLNQRVNYGYINLAIWKKEHINPTTGEVTLLFSITTQKSYKNKDGAYKNTSFIDGDDISALTDLLSDARRWIRDEKQAHLNHKIQSGTQVNPVIPHEANAPEQMAHASH